MKRYGDTKTHLNLSAKAERAYNEISPVSIYEDVDDNGDYTYSVNICGERRKNLTESEVCELLEEYAEPLKVRDQMKEDGGYLDWCGCYSTEDGKKYLINDPGGISIYDADADEWKYGKEVDLEAFAKATNPNYDYYKGYDNLTIAIVDMYRRDCRDCPCFIWCDAMDMEVEEM